MQFSWCIRPTLGVVNVQMLWGDNFHFELQDGASKRSQLRGLFRVFDEEVSLQLICESGAKHTETGQRWYVDLVHGQPSSLPPTSVHWIQWQDDECWDAYAARVKRMASDGVVHGRFQLGLRVGPTNPEGLQGS